MAQTPPSSQIGLGPTANTPSLWTIGNIALAVLAFLLTLPRIIDNHAINRGEWEWSVGEWLINYQGGFVRRGFAGEILVRLPFPSDLIAVEALVISLMAIAVTLFAVLVHRVMIRAHTLWPLALWLVPSGFVMIHVQHAWQPFSLNSLQFASRKEILFLVIVLAASVFWSNKTKPSQWRLFTSSVVISAALFFAALVHEGLVAPAAVAAGLGLWFYSPGVPNRIRVEVSLLPIAAALTGILLMSQFLGSDEFHQPILAALDEPTRAWFAEGPSSAKSPIPGAVRYLGFPMTAMPAAVFDMYIASSLWAWWLVASFAALSCSALVLWFTDCSRSGSWLLVLVFGLIGAATLPLFPVTFDWGRWIAYWSTLAVIISLLRIAISPNPPRPVTMRPLPLTVVILVLIVGALIGLREAVDPRGVLFHPNEGWLSGGAHATTNVMYTALKGPRKCEVLELPQFRRRSSAWVR